MSNHEILALYADAKNRHDVDGILRTCHEDCFYESVGMPGRIEGKDALGAFYTELFERIPDYRGDFDGTAWEGDTAAVWGRFGGTLDGTAIEVPVVFLVTFRDGLIAGDTGYFDSAAITAAMEVTA